MDNHNEPEREEESGGRRERVDARDSLFLQAKMHLSADAPVVVLRVRNLSAGGMMADCPTSVEQGRAVEIELRNIGTVPGKIVWARNQQIGVAFETRIDPRLARSSVGTQSSSTLLVKAASNGRRPGLRIE